MQPGTRFDDVYFDEAPFDVGIIGRITATVLYFYRKFITKLYLR